MMGLPEAVVEPCMSDPSHKIHQPYTFEAFVRYAGLLLLFTFTVVLAEATRVAWYGTSAWPLLVYACVCVLTFGCLAWVSGKRPGPKPIIVLTHGLIGLYFASFGLTRLLWVQAPVGLESFWLVEPVLFYAVFAPGAFWLACAVLIGSHRQVAIASIVPAVLLMAGASWLLRSEPDASRVVTSVGMGFALLFSGLLVFEVSHLDLIRWRFDTRTVNQLATELENAKRVHESMFPEPIANEAYRFGYAYRPMRQIGGDFVHLHSDESRERSGGAIYLTLIDVTGHGITSALTVNRLHAELRQYFASTPEPAPEGALGYLNEYVRLTMAEHGLFATGMCVKVDPAAGSVTVVNAGHPFCYFRTSDGLREVRADGAMLGVFPRGAFEMTPMTFGYAPGDKLVMVTDGAIESRSPADEQIGTERLHRIIDRSCRQTVSAANSSEGDSLLQRRMSGRLLDRADLRKPAGLIQQVLRQGLNAHPCALADEIMLSIDDFVQQDSQDDILIATIELLQHKPSTKFNAQANQPVSTEQIPEEVQV